MTLKFETEDVISTRAMGDVKLSFRNRFLFLENLNIVSKIKRNLISISLQIEKLYLVVFLFFK